MAAHRYWRAVNLEAYDGGAVIALSEFWLLAGSTRVDGGATLTSSVAPVSGALANLRDDDTATDAVLARGTVLSWDFGGSPQDVTDIRLGSTADANRFLLIVRLQWSDDGSAWTDAFTAAGIVWPGSRALTASDALQSDQIMALAPLAYYKLDETSGTSFVDSSGNGRTATGSGSLTLGGSGLIADSSGSLALGAGALVTGPDPYGSAYTGSWSVRAVGVVPVGGSNLIGRGQDGFGSGWSIAVGISSTGQPSASVVYGGTSFSATGPTGVYTFGGAVIDLVTTYDSATRTLRVYANGELMASAPVSGVLSLRDSTRGMLLGSGNGVAVAGVKVDEMAWFGNALTLQQVRALSRGRTIRIGLVAGRVTPMLVSGIASQGATPSFAGAALKDRARARPNYLFDPAARGRIRGTVALYGTPTNTPWRRRVTLVRDVDMMPVAQQWSDAVTGAYDFQYIETDQSYSVIAHDYEHNQRAVIADNIPGGAELMP